MKDSTMIGLVTFGVFMTEALVHYNTGIASAKGTPWKFGIPNTNELLKLGAIVGVATLTTTFIIDQLRK
jgi:hypothetical protein